MKAGLLHNLPFLCLVLQIPVSLPGGPSQSVRTGEFELCDSHKGAGQGLWVVPAFKTPRLVGEMGLPGRRWYKIALVFEFQTEERD